MICITCGRMADPNRSFCANCGSAVFADEPRKTRFSVAAAHPTAQTRSKVTESAGSAPVSAPSRRSGASFPLAGLVRLIVFGFILWWVANALLVFPEVRLVWDQIQRGDTPNFEPAINRLKETIGIPVESAVPSAGRERPAPPPEREPISVAPVAPAPAIEPPVAELPPRTSPAPVPDGVYLPGNGVTTPRAVERQLPSYTRQARAANIEGAVRLKGIVRPDGSITDVEVVQSLDSRYGLDRAAVNALEQWRFDPGLRNGRPVPVLVYVDLTFKLR
jgi:TonB family protein